MNVKKKFATICSLMVVFSICIAVFGVTDGVQSDVTTATAKVFYAEKEESTTSTFDSLGGFVGGLIDGNGSDSLGGIGDILGDVTSGSSDGLSGITGGIGDVVGGIEDTMGGIGDSMNGFGDVLGGIGSGGFGDMGSGLGGIFGGLLGGGAETTAAPATTKKPATTNSGSSSSDKGNAATTAPNAGLIIPVPVATQSEAQNQSQNQVQNQVQNQEQVQNQPQGQIQYQPQVQETQSAIIVTEVITLADESIDWTATDNPYAKPTGTYSAGDEDEGIKWLQWIFIYTGYGLDEDGITGILDEDTVAVVKKLQEENDLTVDGNITEEVIKAAEVLYYKTVVGGNVSAIEVSSEATTGEGVSTDAVASEGENKIPVALLIIVLVIIWVLAIGGIVLLFVFKKKKLPSKKGNEVKEERKAKEEAEENKSAENSEDKNNDDKTGICSMADLFEEAESKKK